MSKLRAISSTAIATMALGGSLMIVAPAANAQVTDTTSDSSSSTSSTETYSAPRKVTSSYSSKSSSSYSSKSSKSSSTSSSVTFGTRSEAVRSLQKKLTAAGYEVPATGYFGSITRGALEDFQADNGLTVTGRATARTMSALADADSSDASSESTETDSTESSDSTESESSTESTSSARTLASSSRSVTSSVSSSKSSSSAAQAAVNFAYGAIGTPYVYGGNGNGGYDCSGLTSAAYRAAGISIPRTSYAQWSGLQSVSTSNLQPGDIVVFYGGGHVGIYVGDGMVIHASRPGKPVAKVSMNTMPISGAVRPA